MDLHELEHKTVNDLREMAAKYDDIKGVSGMKKDDLLDVLCDKLGIDRKEHVPTGIGRHDIKARIQKLKAKRAEALAAHDATALASVRREIKSNKRHLRRVILHAVRSEKAAEAAAKAGAKKATPSAPPAADTPPPAEAPAASDASPAEGAPADNA